VRAQHIVPAMQPGFFWEFGDGYLQNYGRHRADTVSPVKRLITAGVPVTHDAPLVGIEQALTRKIMAREVCGFDERVALTTALRTHTIHNAFASCEEGLKGSLEPGKAADMVVLAENIRRVSVERLREVGVAMTVVGGAVVYEA